MNPQVAYPFSALLSDHHELELGQLTIRVLPTPPPPVVIDIDLDREPAWASPTVDGTDAVIHFSSVDLARPYFGGGDVALNIKA